MAAGPQAGAALALLRSGLQAGLFVGASVSVTTASSLAWACLAHAFSPAAALRTFGLLGAGATCGALSLRSWGEITAEALLGMHACRWGSAAARSERRALCDSCCCSPQTHMPNAAPAVQASWQGRQQLLPGHRR